MMSTKDMVLRFLASGISMQRIAEVAQINKTTIVSLRKGVKIAPITEKKIRSALKDIAQELYTIAYDDEMNDDSIEE